MNKVKLTFVNSIKEEILLFRKLPKLLRYNTGWNNYEKFFNYLKAEIIPLLENKTQNEKEKVVSKILNREYIKYKPILIRNLKQIKLQWKETGSKFIASAEKTFDSHPFPPGEYKAIMTLWGMYPYDLKMKCLYFPANKDHMLRVAIHELLHFMFFDYFNKHFKNKLDKERLWELSEILNPLIMNEMPYRAWFTIDSKPYEPHKGEYNKLLPYFKERKSMKEFIEIAIVILQDCGHSY